MSEERDPYAVQRRAELARIKREWNRAAKELGIDPDTFDREDEESIRNRVHVNNPGRY